LCDMIRFGLGEKKKNKDIKEGGIDKETERE
jgi:hypothetical protein